MLQVVSGLAGFHALFTVPKDQSESLKVSLDTGSAPEAGGKLGCQNPQTREFVVSLNRTPDIPSDATVKAGRILMAAFVIALLLESAFAIVFNWRLYHEFLVGKAWRTPIMFVGAYIVVKAFDMDLMASLFKVYSPPPSGLSVRGDWFTAALTAMILAGGSAGVNRVMVGLGFRTNARPDVFVPKLEAGEAWIAIRFHSADAKKHFRIDLFEQTFDAIAHPDLVATVGFVRQRGLLERLKELFFPGLLRFPRSGGRLVQRGIATALPWSIFATPTRSMIFQASR